MCDLLAGQPVRQRQQIGGHLHRSADILTEQIARAVSYLRNGGSEPGAAESRFSEDVVMDTVAQIPRLREGLALDVQAAFDGDPAAKSIEEVVFSYPAIDAISDRRPLRCGEPKVRANGSQACSECQRFAHVIGEVGARTESPSNRLMLEARRYIVATARTGSRGRSMRKAHP